MPTANPPAAYPRTPEEVSHLPSRPEVTIAAKQRGVREVLHFTTVRGAIGVLASGALKSRERLEHDDYLEHVYKPNAPIRKDPAWLDYVSLSISRINDWMFESSERWHAAEDNPWVVLSFDPEILGHPGVVFATTNNIYPACKRAEGLAGFKRLFADQVHGRYDELHDRTNKRPEWPTDRQAEVLYPGELSCDHLQRIDVQVEATIDKVEGIKGGLNLDDVPVLYAPEVFE